MWSCFEPVLGSKTYKPMFGQEKCCYANAFDRSGLWNFVLIKAEDRGGGPRGLSPPNRFFFGGGGLGPRQDFWEIQEKVPFLHLFFAFFVSLFLLLFHLFLQNLRIWGRRNWFRDGLTQKFLKQSGEHLWNCPPPPNRFRNPPPDEIQPSRLFKIFNNKMWLPNSMDPNASFQGQNVFKNFTEPKSWLSNKTEGTSDTCISLIFVFFQAGIRTRQI